MGWNAVVGATVTGVLVRYCGHEINTPQSSEFEALVRQADLTNLPDRSGSVKCPARTEHGEHY
jgi:hypothetical protein